MSRARTLGKQAVNRALRARGYELRRAGSRRRAAGLDAGERLVQAPAFILSSVRSGSTLVRVLLDSHSRIHSPSELHLRDLVVESRSDYSDRALKAIGLRVEDVQYLLWDRLLHRELAASGKRIIADKTPNNVFIVDRLRECWADARFIFLLRHPGAIVRSRQAYKSQPAEQADEDDKNAELIRRYCEALEAARQAYDGHTVRYEDLTADPERELRRICSFLDVPFEPGMLEYGQFDHGRYKSGLGDWNEKIKSGAIQPPAPPPPLEEIPPALREISEKWGYLAAEFPLDRRA
jgi:hypothetical protein